MIRILIAAALASGATAANAANLTVAFDNFTYSGSVTAPGGDAHAIQTATNGPRSTRDGARDGAIFVSRGTDGKYGGEFAQVSTAWYFSTETPFRGNGWGNPNNSNNGFIQFYESAASLPGVAISGGWSTDLKTFTLNMSGGNGDAFNLARLWNAPSAGGAAGNTAGAFQSFNLTLTATFADAATYNAGTGWWEQDAMPLTLAGGITGSFLNDSTTLPSANGLYTFDLALDGVGSWAGDNNAYWNSADDPVFVQSFWAAAVPEPATWAMMIGGFGFVGGALRRRRQTVALA